MVRAPVSMTAWQIQDIMMQRAAGPTASPTIRTAYTFLGSAQPPLGPKDTKGAFARPQTLTQKIRLASIPGMCTVLV